MALTKEEQKQLQEKFEALETRLARTEQVTLITDNSGQFRLGHTLSDEIRKYVTELIVGANARLEDKMQVLELLHGETLRKERRVSWGISIAAIVTAIVGSFTSYKNFDEMLGKEMADYKQRFQEEKTDYKQQFQEEKTDYKQRFQEEEAARRLSTKENTELMQKELVNIQAEHKRIRGISDVAELAYSKVDIQTSKIETVSRELEKISKTDPTVMDRLRLDVGTYVVVAENDLEAFLDEPAYKKWIALPGEGGFKTDKARWTLADGRNIMGSELHRLRGVTNAWPPLPDGGKVEDIKPLYIPLATVIPPWQSCSPSYSAHTPHSRYCHYAYQD